MFVNDNGCLWNTNYKKKKVLENFFEIFFLFLGRIVFYLLNFLFVKAALNWAAKSYFTGWYIATKISKSARLARFTSSKLD